MHLAELRLRNYRNYSALDASFSPGFHILMGDNAQGKTNVLEAIYLMSTLRSFRGVGSSQLVQQGHKGYFVGGTVQSEGNHDIKLYWSPSERRLSVNQEPVKRLADYLGKLRVVAFCTEDLLLIKGTAKARRRYVDLLLSQTFPTYINLLQRYTRTLRSRNAILKRFPVDMEMLKSFTQQLITLGNEIISKRNALTPKLSPLARLAYRRISNDAEELKIEYQPSVKNDFEVELEQSQSRDLSRRVTLVGPHRDDFKLLLNNLPAQQYGSEGQKRSLAIALKIAQAEYISGIYGSPPILLIDDVMGELDLKRRSGFLPLLHRSNQAGGQVFMTCTERSWPEELARDSNVWNVFNGVVSPK